MASSPGSLRSPTALRDDDESPPPAPPGETRPRAALGSLGAAAEGRGTLPRDHSSPLIAAESPAPSPLGAGGAKGRLPGAKQSARGSRLHESARASGADATSFKRFSTILVESNRQEKKVSELVQSGLVLNRT